MRELSLRKEFQKLSKYFKQREKTGKNLVI